MADEIASLGFKVDSSGLVKADQRLDRVTESGKRTEQQNELVGGSFGRMAKMVGVATAALAGFGAGSKLLDIARQFDVFEAQLKTATGSISAARDVMKELMDFAESTPFDVSQSIEGFVQLKNLGLDPSIESLRSYGNTASAMGKSLNQMVEAVADAATFEFERLKEFGIRASQEADRVIFTFRGVETSIAKDSESIQEYLLALGNNEFASAMEDRVNSLDGALSNLQDSWDNLFLAVSDQGAGGVIEQSALLAASALEDVTKNIDALTDALQVMVAVAGTGALVKLAPTMYAYAASSALAAKNTLMAGTATYTTSAGFAGLGGSVARTTVAMNAFGVASRFALGPWGLLIAAVGAAAATFVSTKSEADSLTESIDKQRTAVQKMVDNYQDMNELGQNNFWIKSNQQIGDLLTRMTEVDRTISKLRGAMSGADSSSRQDLREEIKRLQEERQSVVDAYNQIKDAQEQIFAGGMPDQWQGADDQKGQAESISSTTSELEKQIEALKIMRQEVGMTSDELFIFRQQQKALAEEDGAAFVDQVTAMSQSIVEARKNLRFDEQIEELSELQKQVGKTSDEMFVLNQVGKAIDAGLGDKQVQKVRELSQAIVEARKSAAETSEYEQWVKTINDSYNSVEELTQQIEKLKEAIEMGDIDPEAGKQAIKEIREEIKALNDESTLTELFADSMGAAQQGAMAMREFADEGSKQYERLTRAAQAFGVAQSLATGNYLGAIAGAASLISSLGDYSFEDISAQVQANQNLNIWGEKSDSIDRSTQITANATEKLVGINTDMLRAFQNVDATIAKAAGIISRDVNPAQVDIGGLGIMDNVFSFITDNPIADIFNKLTLGIFGGVFDAIGGWLGGSSKVVDEGVRIFGGTLSDLMEEVVVQGYQVVKYKKWRFGSTKTARQFTDLTSEVGGEIAQIFTYMGDAISSGMQTLGFNLETVEMFFDDFAEIDTARLSLKGLSPAEQQKELEAYFSSVFNTLAEQFDVNFGKAAIGTIQQVGEEFGEAFTRAVTQAQVLDQAVSDFGLNFGMTLEEIAAIENASPSQGASREEWMDYNQLLRQADDARYAFILAADEMANMTGGLDSFIDKLNGFSSFASDATNLEILGGRLESRFSDMNITLPETADGLWELVQTLDGTTQSGREQIATILNLQDTAKAYYQLLERENKRILDDKKSQLTEELNAENQRIDELNSGYAEQISLLQEQKTALESNLADAESAVNSAFTREIEKIREAGQARVEQLNKEKSLANESISLLSGIISNAQSAINSVYSSQSVNAATLDQAIEAARRGDFSVAQGANLSGAFRDSSEFSTQFDLSLSQAQTAMRIQELSALAGSQKSIEEMTLSAIEAQIKATQDGTEKQVERLEQQRDTLLGISENQLSVHQAAMQYRDAKRELDELNYDAQVSYYEEQIKANNEEYELLKTAYDKQIELLEESNNIDEYYYKQILENQGGGDFSNANNPPPAQSIRSVDSGTAKEIQKLRDEQRDIQAQMMRITSSMASDISDLRRIEVSKEEIQ